MNGNKNIGTERLREDILSSSRQHLNSCYKQLNLYSGLFIYNQAMQECRSCMNLREKETSFAFKAIHYKRISISKPFLCGDQ